MASEGSPTPPAGRKRALRIWLRHVYHRLATIHPAKLAVLGYLSYIVGGWLVLCLPWVQRISVRAIDNLFIAASAVSTTGLVTVSVSDSYNIAGQLVVLLLIQLGGIGYMTFGSFVILSRKRVLPGTRTDVGLTVFSLPESFRIDKFIRSVVVFTAAIEVVGAALLYVIFRQAGVAQPLWNAIFHSISAFCTAGFSLFNTSFEGMVDNFWLNVVVASLSYLGAIGFIVCVDLYRMLQGKEKQMTLTSKIILWSTVWLSLLGTIILFVTESSIQDMPSDKRLLAAFFQAMTAMTTVGFNTVDIGQISKASMLLVIALMIIGASPSGTGGGVKSTTVSAVWGVMRSALQGDREVRFWGRPVPLERVWTAVASMGLYLMFLFLGTYLLELTETSNFDENFFEAASALGTVGLSRGITAGLSNLGKIVITLLMFCGRLGPLTFAMALFLRKTGKVHQRDADLAV